MRIGKIFLLSLFSVLFVNFVYAEGIASRQEAVNYYNEGVRAQKKGDFDKAFKEYQMSLILSTEYSKFILHNKGVMFMQQGNLAQAVQNFQEVLKLDPNYMPAKINLGLIYDTQPDKCKALEYWADLFNLENLKPKDFVLEGEKKAAQ
ncbi:MAG: tetratricopeptide repeat protein [Candidatus Omnitrophota bacterium]|jgi:tetratricopeptide (TPR) repeat protein